MIKKEKIELFVRQDVGSGTPLILLHGLFADGTQWEKMTEVLKKDFRVIVLDLLGHGRSPRPIDATYSPEEQIEAMHNALERINATQDLTIVGYSMGGAVALSYSSKYNEQVRQLYLISVPFYLQPDQMVAANFAASALITKASNLLFKTVENSLRTGKVLNRSVPYGDKSKKFHKMIGAHDNKLDPIVIRSSIKNLVREFDFCGTLQRVTAPVTFYAGKKDPFIVQGQLPALKKYNPYMNIERLDIIKIDHMLVQNLPHEIAKLIQASKQDTLHVAFDEGVGDPLVLLHGIESSASFWDPVAPVLAKSRRVITIDLLGFGDSPKPLNIAYTLDDHVEWLTRTLKKIGIDSCEIAGHSLGSLVALSYTAKHPTKVKKLTMFSPVIVAHDADTNNILLRNLRYFYRFSDTGYLFDHTARAVGETTMAKFIPSLRSVENAVERQNSDALARDAAAVELQVIYGDKDQLVDAGYVKRLFNVFHKKSIISVPGASHNFPLFMPVITLEAFGVVGHPLNKPSKVPKSFAKQLVKLAAPKLLLKSLLYISAGLLLFSDYAPAVLTIGLAMYVAYKGYGFIQGAFTLRNEGLAYIGYILLGAFLVLVGYGLFNDPQTATKISVITISAIALVVGLVRIFASIYWTTNKLLKRSLLVSGGYFALLGLAAFSGSVWSVYLVIYSIAVVLILRGAQFGIFSLGAVTMAYVRGFNKN